MDFLKIAQTRYTTKKYDNAKQISDSEIIKLQKILRLSPSSINSQPWKFIFISDKKIKSTLAEVSYFNKKKILDASHLVVFSVVDSLPIFEKQIKANIPIGAVNYYNEFLKPKSTEAIKSWLTNQVYLSLGVFLSACASMQIDTTPMEGIIAEKYNSILKLKNYNTLFAVAVGYRDTKDPNQPNKKPKSRLEITKIICTI